MDFSGSLALFLLLVSLFAVLGNADYPLSIFLFVLSFASLKSSSSTSHKKMDLALSFVIPCGVCLALFVGVVDFVCLFASHEVTLLLLSEILVVYSPFLSLLFPFLTHK